MAHVLIVEDEINVLKITQMMLSRAGHEVSGFGSGMDAVRHIEMMGYEKMQLDYDVVLTDYCLGDVTGLEVLKAVKRVDSSTQVLLVTAYAKTTTAVEVMREGALDYIEKPVKRDELIALVEKAALRRKQILEEHDENASDTPKKPVEQKMFMSNAPAMREVLDMVYRVSPTRANILITGESGTGKEVIARLVHKLSGLTGAFVPVNCGAIPESLVESEFFGYMKGSFTGALRDKPGFFQAASGGTIFLDEIGELPLAMQVKLLRALQEKKVQPVGSATEIPVNVRVIAATNKDLRTEVEAHRFREDLFFRLNVIQLSLPPLRERSEDLPKLIEYFLKKFGTELGREMTGVEPDAMHILLSYEYRGNVRELENIIEHAVTLSVGPKVSVSSLPAYLRNSFMEGAPGNAASFNHPAPKPRRTAKNAENAENAEKAEKTYMKAEARPESTDSEARVPDYAQESSEQLAKIHSGEGIELEHIVEDLERSLIEQALAKANGNKTEAAKLLGISFRSMRYRLKKYNME